MPVPAMAAQKSSQSDCFERGVSICRGFCPHTTVRLGSCLDVRGAYLGVRVTRVEGHAICQRDVWIKC